jgi:hypothetical protein
MTRKPLMWVLAALLGIVLTAGITWASSQLTSQRIGLSSEPISAGVRLAPSLNTATHSVTTTRRVETRPTHTTTTTTTLTVTTPAPTPAPVETVPQTTTSTTRTGEDGSQGRSTGPSSSARGRDD